MIQINKKSVLIFLMIGINYLTTLPGLCISSQEQKLQVIQEKSRKIKEKLEETKRKERVAVTKLSQIQRDLYKAQQDLRRSKSRLEVTQSNLEVTEEKLAELKNDHLKLAINAQGRIRQIYQGQRLKMLEFLFQSSSFTDFLDNLHYQKLILARDKILLDKLNKQAMEIESYKDQLAADKIKIANIVSKIDEQKKTYAIEQNKQQDIVSQLKTERSAYEKAERQLERDSEKLIAAINSLVGKSKSSGITAQGSGLFSYPLIGKLTSPFGPRRHPIHGVVSFHSGIDIAAPNGTSIMASDSGTVIYNGWYGGYGKVIILDHGQNFSTLYAHLSRASAPKGRSVKKGDIIGSEGTTGYSTGPHLHFEVRKSGKPENPIKYLR